MTRARPVPTQNIYPNLALVVRVVLLCCVQEAKIAREMRVEEHQRKVKEITTAVMEVVGLCAEHREMVQLRLGEVPTVTLLLLT